MKELYIADLLSLRVVQNRNVVQAKRCRRTVAQVRTAPPLFRATFTPARETIEVARTSQTIWYTQLQQV
jgi:hypothetical protein